MYEHLGYARNKVTSEAMGEHYNLPGHSTNNMDLTIIEKVDIGCSNFKAGYFF